jgi:hypothetical protein
MLPTLVQPPQNDELIEQFLQPTWHAPQLLLAASGKNPVGQLVLQRVAAGSLK